MKFNIKRTILVGLAFLSISAFWELYDNVIPLILQNSFRLGDGVIGVVMAMDNTLALFMLPLFGMLSDRSHSRIGKRMPYILCGTVGAVVLTNLLPFADKQGNLMMFAIVLGFLLIAMSIYRSPAVALMPDVTPKRLRSKGNAVINLMGTLGGAFTLGVIRFTVTKDSISGRDDYTLFFVVVTLFMLIAVGILFFTIRENELSKKVTDLEKNAENNPPHQPAAIESEPSPSQGLSSLSPELRKSLMLILASVFLWFMGYNAVISAFTRYAENQWQYGIAQAADCKMIALVGALVSFIPVGLLSTRFGRKRVIQAGVITLAVCFAVSAAFQGFHPIVYVIFALIGASWAMINVNSYPMVVEISKSADVGKFTGYYYTFSMAAQIATPILSGLLLEHVGYWTLLPYAAIMVALSFVTISLTRHGDSKPQPPGSRLEAFAGED